MDMPIYVTSSTTTASASTWQLFQPISPKFPHRAAKCYVCGKSGPGLSALADGKPVHRWPCRDIIR